MMVMAIVPKLAMITDGVVQLTLDGAFSQASPCKTHFTLPNFSG